MSLRLHQVGPNDAPLTVMLLHGFGAPGNDLVPLATEFIALQPALRERARFVFPEALLPLDEAGPSARAWWHIDLDRLATLDDQGADAQQALRNEVPRGLPEAREAVLTQCDTLRRAAPAGQRWVLGGFSQGAMLATDVALRMDPSPRGLVLFSGALVNAKEWEALAPGRAGLRVFQSHGTQDPILPYDNAERLRELLVAAGLQVDFLSFRGGHTMPLRALERSAALLQSLLE